MRPDNFVGRVEGGELFLGKETRKPLIETEEIEEILGKNCFHKGGL